MSEKKSPREFWIRLSGRNTLYYTVFREKPACESYEEAIKVREVDPTEPDWKSLCAELAEAMELATTFFHEQSWDMKPVYDALEKYRQAVEESK